MKLFLCDSLETTLAELRAQADETLGELVRGEVHQIEARGGSEATRRALRELGEGAECPRPPHVLLVHARAVGGAAAETEAWFAALAGYDLGILYSEAWDGDPPAVATLVPGRWKVGTRLLRGRIRSLLEAFRVATPGTTIEPVHLERGAWESILAEPVMELLVNRILLFRPVKQNRKNTFFNGCFNSSHRSSWFYRLLYLSVTVLSFRSD